jgi:predicted dienelactone hydrolase
MTTRRTLIRAGAAVAAAATTSIATTAIATGSRAAVAQATPTLSLPAPTGRHRVGTTSLHLVDHTRTDPLAPSARARELMVRLWYPAVRGHYSTAAYLPTAVATRYVQFINDSSGADHPDDLLAFPTRSRQDAAAIAGRHPILLFSHGYGVSAALNTGLHENLASHGYVVAGIDHTYDAGAVEFPDGRVVSQKPNLPVDELLRAVRTADALFVLGRLIRLAAGHHPGGGRRLPRGLYQSLDPTRIGGYGHSLGGPTIVTAMQQDRRIDAGAGLDGDLLDGDLTGTGLNRPFLMMGNHNLNQADAPEWATFYDRLTGPRLHLILHDAEHADLTDITAFKTTIDVSTIFTTGPINGLRSLAIQRDYLTAWFNRALRGRDNRLLHAEPARYPEVDVQP